LPSVLCYLARMVTRAALLAMVREAFATPQDARRWWRTPHPLFNGLTPSAAAKTPPGAERVRDMLVALRFGGVV
jgi:uncharacterized protein (DUF2384 family)